MGCGRSVFYRIVNRERDQNDEEGGNDGRNYYQQLSNLIRGLPICNRNRRNQNRNGRCQRYWRNVKLYFIRVFNYLYNLIVPVRNVAEDIISLSEVAGNLEKVDSSQPTGHIVRERRDTGVGPSYEAVPNESPKLTTDNINNVTAKSEEQEHPSCSTSEQVKKPKSPKQTKNIVENPKLNKGTEEDIAIAKDIWRQIAETNKSPKSTTPLKKVTVKLEEPEEPSCSISEQKAKKPTSPKDTKIRRESPKLNKGKEKDTAGTPVSNKSPKSTTSNIKKGQEQPSCSTSEQKVKKPKSSKETKEIMESPKLNKGTEEDTAIAENIWKEISVTEKRIRPPPLNHTHKSVQTDHLTSLDIQYYLRDLMQKLQPDAEKFTGIREFRLSKCGSSKHSNIRRCASLATQTDSRYILRQMKKESSEDSRPCDLPAIAEDIEAESNITTPDQALSPESMVFTDPIFEPQIEGGNLIKPETTTSPVDAVFDGSEASGSNIFPPTESCVSTNTDSLSSGSRRHLLQSVNPGAISDDIYPPQIDDYIFDSDVDITPRHISPVSTTPDTSQLDTYERQERLRQKLVRYPSAPEFILNTAEQTPLDEFAQQEPINRFSLPVAFSEEYAEFSLQEFKKLVSKEPNADTAKDQTSIEEIDTNHSREQNSVAYTTDNSSSSSDTSPPYCHLPNNDPRIGAEYSNNEQTGACTERLASSSICNLQTVDVTNSLGDAVTSVVGSHSAILSADRPEHAISDPGNPAERSQTYDEPRYAKSTDGIIADNLAVTPELFSNVWKRRHGSQSTTEDISEIGYDSDNVNATTSLSSDEHPKLFKPAPSSPVCVPTVKDKDFVSSEATSSTNQLKTPDKVYEKNIKHEEATSTMINSPEKASTSMRSLGIEDCGKDVKNSENILEKTEATAARSTTNLPVTKSSEQQPEESDLSETDSS